MMPTAERRKKEAEKKAAAGNGATKEVSKRAPQGPQQLVNEHQETIMNTDLSNAADDYAKATMEHRLWGEKKHKAEIALINEMKNAKISSMKMGGDKIIKYKYVDAKETITIKDYKPKTSGRRVRR